MVVYAIGSGLLAYLIKIIVDGLQSLERSGAALTGRPLLVSVSLWPGGPVTRVTLGVVALLILVAYFLKGTGGYGSSYLMADVGQRVVRDLRDRLFRHIVDQS